MAEAHEQCDSGYTSDNLHALHATFSLECYPRSSTGTLAKPLPVVANGDLLRSQNAANTFHRVLGVRVAGEKQFMAVPEVDGRDGTIRATAAESPIDRKTYQLSCAEVSPISEEPQGAVQCRLRSYRYAA